MGKEFRLQFDIIPTDKENGWGSVLRMYNQDINGVRPEDPIGARIPAIWMQKDYRIHICFDIIQEKPTCSDSYLQPGSFATVIIQQILKSDGIFGYSILINQKEVFKANNSQPQDFDDVKLAIGDRFYEPAKALVKNIKFESFGRQTHLL